MHCKFIAFQLSAFGSWDSFNISELVWRPQNCWFTIEMTVCFWERSIFLNYPVSLSLYKWKHLFYSTSFLDPSRRNGLLKSIFIIKFGWGVSEIQAVENYQKFSCIKLFRNLFISLEFFLILQLKTQYNLCPKICHNNESETVWSTAILTGQERTLVSVNVKIKTPLSTHLAINLPETVFFIIAVSKTKDRSCRLSDSSFQTGYFSLN